MIPPRTAGSTVLIAIIAFALIAGGALSFAWGAAGLAVSGQGVLRGRAC